MKIPGRVVSIASFALAFFLAVPLQSRAQMRMAPMAARPVGAISMRAVRPMRPVAAHTATVAHLRTSAVRGRHPGTAPFIPPANNNFDFANGFNFDNGFYGGSGETIQQLLDPVPPPGFDYAYLAGIDKDLALKALIDPQTEERLAVAEQVVRATGGFGGGGYYLLDGGGGYIMPAETAAETGADGQPDQSGRPEVIVLQQPAQKPAEESAEPPQPAQPVPDVGNFTIVLKDGEKIQAMAFTQLGSQIIYITPDGDRHTVAASDVNDTATQQLNQDSGKELRF
jgi:hypothetical protein